MKKILLYYSFVVTTLMVVSSFISASSFTQLVSASLFYPVFAYFIIHILPKRQKAVTLPKETEDIPKLIHRDESVEELKPVEITTKGKKYDNERRAFLKIIGTAGTAAFIFTIFGVKKAEAAFFGSVPGPGIIGIKDSAGLRIDPAKNHPTDGYRIAELDDSTPAYYGFLNKDGAWFIMRESSNSYKYKTGSSGFSASWSGRGTIPEIQWLYYDTAF